MKVTRARHRYPEKAPFSLIREKGLETEYVFLHFLTPVKLRLGRETVPMPPSTCILYNTGTPQIWHAELPLVHDWVHITGGVGQAIHKFGLAFDKPYILQNSFFVTSIINEIEHEFFSRDSFSEQLIRLKLNELFAKIARGKASGVETVKEKETFEKARLIIFADLSREWKIADMAKLTNFSESRFFVLYKRVFGISPMRDLIHARIESAKRLRSQNKYSVAQIAKMTGFASEHHFIRQFKEHVGTSPGRFSR